jgi:hypothetical protein
MARALWACLTPGSLGFREDLLLQPIRKLNDIEGILREVPDGSDAEPSTSTSPSLAEHRHRLCRVIADQKIDRPWLLQVANDDVDDFLVPRRYRVKRLVLSPEMHYET